MKYFITVALLAIIFNNAIGQITESKATQIAMEYIDNLKQMDYLVYRYPKPIDEKTIIPPPARIYNPCLFCLV